MLLIYKSLHNIAIFVDATVAKERPPTAHILAMSKVYVNNDTLLLAMPWREIQEALAEL